jgi:hypothetical protein
MLCLGEPFSIWDTDVFRTKALLHAGPIMFYQAEHIVVQELRVALPVVGLTIFNSGVPQV